MPVAVSGFHVKRIDGSQISNIIMKHYPCKDVVKPANSMLQNGCEKRSIISAKKVFACYDRQQKQARIAA